MRLIAIYDSNGWGDNYGIRDARTLVSELRSGNPSDFHALTSILGRCDKTMFGYENIVGGIEERGLAPGGFEDELYRLFKLVCVEARRHTSVQQAAQADAVTVTNHDEGVPLDFDRSNWTPADEKLLHALESSFLSSLNAADHQWAQMNATSMFMPMILIIQKLQLGLWEKMQPHYKRCLVETLVDVFSQSDVDKMRGGRELEAVARSFNDFLKAKLPPG